MITCLIITDGRAEYLLRMLLSLDPDLFDARVLIDDSGDPDYGEWLDRIFDDTETVVLHQHGRQGLVAAVNSAWTYLQETDTDFVFHVEEDFVFPTTPPIKEMIALLEADPTLANIVLKRQAWNPVEMAAGGIIEANPHLYEDRENYLAHREVFSLNPCIYRAEIMGYRMGEAGESDLTTLLVEAGWHFGIFGSRDDFPRCEHIGARRSVEWTL